MVTCACGHNRSDHHPGPEATYCLPCSTTRGAYCTYWNPTPDHRWLLWAPIAAVVVGLAILIGAMIHAIRGGHL